MKGRLGGHLHKKPGWRKAVAVCPEGKDWDEAEVSWLEARLHRLLSESSNVKMINSQVPNDGRLSEVRQMRLNNVTQAVLNVLALVGYPINSDHSASSTADTSTGRAWTEDTRRKVVASIERVKGISIKTLLDAGFLDAGETLRSRSGNVVSVTLQPDGTLLGQNGESYNTPSAAARALTTRRGTGWIFWQRSNGQTLSDAREDYLQQQTTIPKTEGELS